MTWDPCFCLALLLLLPLLRCHLLQPSAQTTFSSPAKNPQDSGLKLSLDPTVVRKRLLDTIWICLVTFVCPCVRPKPEFRNSSTRTTENQVTRFDSTNETTRKERAPPSRHGCANTSIDGIRAFLCPLPLDSLPCVSLLVFRGHQSALSSLSANNSNRAKAAARMHRRQV